MFFSSAIYKEGKVFVTVLFKNRYWMSWSHCRILHPKKGEQPFQIHLKPALRGRVHDKPAPLGEDCKIKAVWSGEKTIEN